MELRKSSKGKTPCPTYSNYCASPNHSNSIICHAIMQNYYSFKNKKEKYFICPFCKSVENVEYDEFYNTHINHLRQFTCQKKSIFQMVVPIPELLGSRKRPIEIDDESDEDDEKRLKCESNENKTNNVDMSMSELYFSTCLKPLFQEVSNENVKNESKLYAHPNTYKPDLKQDDINKEKEMKEGSIIEEYNNTIVKCITQEINEIDNLNEEVNREKAEINKNTRNMTEELLETVDNQTEINTENYNGKTMDLEEKELKKGDKDVDTDLKNTINKTEEQLETTVKQAEINIENYDEKTIVLEKKGDKKVYGDLENIKNITEAYLETAVKQTEINIEDYEEKSKDLEKEELKEGNKEVDGDLEKQRNMTEEQLETAVIQTEIKIENYDEKAMDMEKKGDKDFNGDLENTKNITEEQLEAMDKQTEIYDEKAMDKGNKDDKELNGDLENTKNMTDEQLETENKQVKKIYGTICEDVVISHNKNEDVLETGNVREELETQTVNSHKIDREIINKEEDANTNTKLVEYQQEDGFNFIFSLTGKLTHWKFSPDCRVEDIIIFLESRGFNRNKVSVLYSFPSQDLLNKVKNFDTKLSDVKGLLKNQVFNVRLLKESVDSNINE